jgi:hypothetical protein
VLTLLSPTLWAQGVGHLYVFNRSNMTFVACLNGQLINATPYGDLMLENLPVGTHDLHLSVFFPGGGQAMTQQVTIGRGLEASYELRMGGRGGRPVLVLSQSVPMDATPHTTNTPTWATQPNGNGAFTFNWRGFGVNIDITGNQPTTRPRDPQHPNHPGNPNTDTPPPLEDPNYTGPMARCQNPLSLSAYSAALGRIQSRPTESAKYSIAKDEIERAGCITSAQALEFMKALGLSSSRLNLGKVAWHHVADPENFHVTYDAFTMGTQIDQLKAYVRQHPYPNVVPSPNPNPNPLPQPLPQPDHYVMPGYTGQIGCPWPMLPDAFARAKQTISKQSFESTKISVMKQMAAQNCFTVDQVKELVRMLTFDNSKLDMAKYLFDYTYDLSNYFMVSEVFTFSGSTEDLNRFLESRRR